MIAVREGQDRILARIAGAVPPEVVPVTRALGRVLADDVQAPFDVPPADNSAVDGYAVASADIPSSGRRSLDVVGDLAAGAVFDGRLQPGQALRIMTGAPMPAGVDTVYPQENVERDGDRVWIGPIDKGVNVRLRGEDVETGAIVVERGTVLRPQEIGLITSSASGSSACTADPAWPCCPPATRWPSRGRRAARGRSTTPTGSRSAAPSSCRGARCSIWASCPTLATS